MGWKRALAIMAGCMIGCAAPANAEPASPVPPRPARPAEPTLPALTESQCADASTRADIVAHAETLLEPIMGYGAALSAYSESLMEWKADQLMRSGKWSEDQKARFGANLLDDPDFNRATVPAMEPAMEMLRQLQAVGDTRNPAGQCRAVVAINGLMGRTIAASQAQWAAIDAAYAAEARRLGVTIE